MAAYETPTSRSVKQPSLPSATSISKTSGFMNNNYSPSSTSSSALQGLPTPPLIHDSDPRPPRIPNGSQVLVTVDIDAAYFVDLSKASSPAAIKEKIYAKLGIYDDEHANCRISRCRAGQPIGQPLDDWQLWDMCMRASLDVDPPMLIVHSVPSLHHQPTPSTSSSSSSSSVLNHQASQHLSQIRSGLSPRSPDSSSIHKFDSYSSSGGGRDSPDPNTRSSRNRWQKPGQAPNSPRAINATASSTLSTTHPASVHDLRGLSIPSSNPANLTSTPLSSHPSHASPISPPFPDDQGMSLIEMPSHLQSRRLGHPLADSADDWARSPNMNVPPNHELSQKLQNYHGRRPSEPYMPMKSPLHSSGAQTDSRSPDNRHIRPPASLSANFHNHPSHSSARNMTIGSSVSSSSRKDLTTAKSMEDLRGHHGREGPKWAIPGVTHPPLPGSQPTSKIPLPPRTRNPNPTPLRIPRSETSGQRSGQQTQLSGASRPPYPTSPNPTPSFPFPQPQLGLNQRPLRQPGYGASHTRPGSSGGPVRVDPRLLSRQPISSSGVLSRASRGSLQIENRLLESSRPPPRPRTGDASSNIRSGPSNLPINGLSQVHQAISPSSLQLRPGEVLPDPMAQARLRNRSRDYTRDLTRENGLRRALNHPSPSASSIRAGRSEDQIEYPSRQRYSNGKSGSQASSVQSSDSSYNSMSPSRVVSNPDAYGGVAPEDSQEQESNGSIPFDGQLPSSVTHHAPKQNLGDYQEITSSLSQMSMQNETPSSASTGSHTMKGAGSSLLRRGRSPSTLSTPATTWTGSSTSPNPAPTGPSNNDFSKKFGYVDDDDEEEVGTFLAPMQPYEGDSSSPNHKGAAEPIGSIKPKLTLQTDSHRKPQELVDNGNLEAITEDVLGPAFTGSTLRSATAMNPQPSGGNLSASSAANQRASRRISFTGDDWAVRPPVDQVYENLEEFFPHHDLDKPIDIGPVTIDVGSPSSPQEPSGATFNSSNGPLAPNAPSAASQARLKGRTRSIRVVAQEKKRLLRRSEDKVRAASQIGGNIVLDRSLSVVSGLNGATHNSMGSALLRRKSTKLWGARIEEVTPGGQVSVPSSIPESPRDSESNFSFKWVKGELIGKGSFGQVYLALNATNGEMLAVKQVELPKTRSDRDCDRQKSVVAALKSEIHLMRDLEHPNIVQYLGFEETNVYISIFLEYVPGGSIGRCLRRHGAFELNVIKSFTSQTLEGLKYLHSLNILHRDLKADNLLVDLDGNCKISDFGISKKSEHVYEDNTQMSLQGSIFWMAPEVVHSKKGYSAKVDIWSLGCVVLEMFAGRRPWSDEEAIQAMFKLGAERLRPPVPDDVKLGRMSDHFLAQCFIVDPELRPTADRLTDHRFLELEDKNWRFEDSELYRSIRMPH